MKTWREFFRQLRADGGMEPWAFQRLCYILIAIVFLIVIPGVFALLGWAESLHK